MPHRMDRAQVQHSRSLSRFANGFSVGTTTCYFFAAMSFSRIGGSQMSKMTPILKRMPTLYLLFWFGLAAIGSSGACVNQRLRCRFPQRKLQSETPYRVRLYLALEYLNNTAASKIESSNMIPSTASAIHFCAAVNSQVRPDPITLASDALLSDVSPFLNILHCSFDRLHAGRWHSS